LDFKIVRAGSAAAQNTAAQNDDFCDFLRVREGENKKCGLLF
jgi:hypothetical protein